VKGHLRERSPGRWAIILSVRENGKRKRHWHSFKGTKAEAEAERIRLLAKQVDSEYVPPSKATLAAFVRSRVEQWQSAGNITPRTAHRYRQIVENQIAPHLGTKALRKISRLDIEAWHTALRKSGLASTTIGLAHRVLGRALADAEKDNLVAKNMCKVERAPKIAAKEMTIVHDVAAFVAKLHGPLRVPAIVALFTGLRLGELLALRWKRVDLDRGVMEVREALEETQAVRFKAPKSKAGRRDITLPNIVIEALRGHRAAVLEQRLQLGQGKLPPDALLFANLEGGPLRPTVVSANWGRLAASIGMPEITLHALRHTHASQAIAAGVDIVTVSRRLGHAKPDVTLRTYAHMFKTDDSKVAAVINAALA